MKKLYFFFIFIFFAASVQSQDAKELQDKAKEYTRQGDYTNAATLLLKALDQLPSDIGIAQDLALNYFFAKENTKALEIIKPLLDRSEVDDQAFQIAGNIYKALNQTKEAEALYKKGIKKFPKSGFLYNDYGELLTSIKNSAAIAQWEKGIEMDPIFSGNYFNAARYYYFTTDKIWSVIYAEIFINIEPSSGRTPEVKSLLLDSYKKLFAEELLKNGNEKNNFEQAFLQSMGKAVEGEANGMTSESLTMIRTRFILDWFEKNAAKYPFKLFEYQQQLLREGIFPAYNQWIFGATQNLMAYQNWTTVNTAENMEFNSFQKGRIFKIPEGQYYHK